MTTTTKNTNMKNTEYNISISVSEPSVFAGSGTLTCSLGVAVISDCPAVFAAGDAVYEAIEAEIEAMDQPGDGSIWRDGVTYSWTLTPARPTMAEYLATLSDAALSDIAAGKWDDVMTDHLYAAMGCDTPEEMQDMRRKAQEAAKLIVITRLHANVRQALGL
jgi:hypothetical protein